MSELTAAARGKRWYLNVTGTDLTTSATLAAEVGGASKYSCVQEDCDNIVAVFLIKVIKPT